MKNRPFRHGFLLILIMAACSTRLLFSQQMSKLDRDRAKEMIADISADIKKHYYDPKIRGVDWEGKVRETKEKIDQSPSMSMALSHVAAALDVLDDSHTFFLPPSRPFRVDFGYELQMIGDKCFVVRVRPHSDAEAKGLKPGDQVLALNGYSPTRATLWKMDYVYRRLRPQAQMKFDLLSPEGQERRVTVTPRVQQLKRIVNLTGADGGGDIWDLIRQEENEEHFYRGRYEELNEDLMILKLPVFDFSDSEISVIMDKARKHKTLIIDLRGNGGGLEEALQNLLGGVLDHDIKVGDLTSRESAKPIVAKSHGKHAFAGKLIVLVDSDSASASELFARVVQLEKRGAVLGDRSSGSVMRAKHYSYQAGTDTLVFFGASITDADIIMTDGKSLEHAGVIPDETMTPSPVDLASGRDPVMAHAADIAGVKLTPEKAASLFPYEWPKD